jgi:hypothetical protein
LKAPTPQECASLVLNANNFLRLNQQQTAVATSNYPINIDSHFLLTTYITPTEQLTTAAAHPTRTPNIHFIRTQRRFNKRRYARVRAVSRPSFWAGAMLSTTATGMFWGATSQNLDWVSTQVSVTDMNTFLAIAYVIFVWKLLQLLLVSPNATARETNKRRRGLLNVFQSIK